MTFFETYFNDTSFDTGEVAVCCPFPHRTEAGHVYKETNPSAHINVDKGVFHCKVCNTGLSEVGFIAEILGTTYEDATRFQTQFKKKEDIFDWDTTTTLDDTTAELIEELGISEKVSEELKLSSDRPNTINFPVFMYNTLLDIRAYSPLDRENKIKSQRGAMSGLVIPFNEWERSPKKQWTIICAGEKDMAVARSNDFNAITITGGEMVLPKFTEPFKDRRIAILYDNDDTGIRGARQLAAFLHPFAQEVRVVTGFHEVASERGEDLTDFFMKYGRSRADLIEYINNTPEFTRDDVAEVKSTKYPQVTLLEASQPGNVNRVVQTNIQVVATFDKALTVPTTIAATKMNTTQEPKNNRMLVGETKSWHLTEKTAQDLLKLMDNNFTENQIRDNTREILGINKQEHNIRISKPTKETVYKCSVIDLFENTDKDTNSLEFEAYVLKHKLEAGKKYKITYKLVPHPYRGQQLTMIILDVEESADSVTNFRVTPEVIQSLEPIANMGGTVEERVEDMTERVKSFISYDGYNQLIQAIEFAYHTVLEFNFGNFENVRGYLDTLIVAESRVGKSSTALALQNLYGLGTFASLAGNSATVSGLIGGSNKVNGSFQTRAGVIPQQHRGLLILEELAKSNANIIKELTDIRSSNQVRIARVSGSVELPALVRMITLTNVKTSGNTIRSVRSYPNGIEIISELVGSAEDIARYDLMLVMGERGKEIDPMWMPKTPFPLETYRNRIRWIWSRAPEQVKISDALSRYIIKECNKINQQYDSYIKIFGTEAWKKVTRLAIAVAGYLVSTDETFENLIVKQEHVDYAIQYILDLYVNDTFKLAEFVQAERMYTEIDEDGVQALQDIFNVAPSILLTLERTSKTSKSNLQTATGMNNEDFNKIMARLVKTLMVKFEGFDIYPTERFRKGMGRINRDAHIMRVGEHLV